MTLTGLLINILSRLEANNQKVDRIMAVIDDLKAVVATLSVSVPAFVKSSAEEKASINDAAAAQKAADEAELAEVVATLKTITAAVPHVAPADPVSEPTP